MSEGQIPAGYYKGCRGVLGSEQYAVSPKGTEQIAVDVFVPELERAFTTFLHFSDAATPYAVERLRALGWKGEDLTDLSGIDSQDVEVQIKYETFDNKSRMKVDIVTGGGGRVKLENPMSDQQKRQFAARMKAFLKGSSNGATAKPAAPAAPAASRREGAYDPGPPENDNIPF